MNVVSSRKDVKAPGKRVEANQKAIDALPQASGTWRVEGVPGLYLRCRVRAKSFFIQRRIRGRLVKETLGVLSMKQAKELAMKTWSGLKPKPAAHEVVTLQGAIELYIADTKLAQSTVDNYRYNAKRYLSDWKIAAFTRSETIELGCGYCNDRLPEIMAPLLPIKLRASSLLSIDGIARSIRISRSALQLLSKFITLKRAMERIRRKR